ncbi:metal transporter [Arenibacter sp. TNZ]|uniref:heavy-metal-associated domain-containing protein n=1 Tax=Arenibacter TaxID=178469 RepID=UPI000CD40069|nr:MULTISPECIES: metal transporter [Arenibacter]MCM4172887.1 metal transporter [Arenibacter sp. TNZ]
MRNLILGAAFALLAVSVQGQEKNKKISFEVNGKCAMCKERIEVAALAVKGVKYALWDIPTHQLSVIIDERKTNSMAIKTAIVGVGHDTKELKATEEAYESVHPCCKYREDNSDDGEHHE